MVPIPELVDEPLRLHAGHEKSDAAHLVETFSLHPQSGLTVALQLQPEITCTRPPRAGGVTRSAFSTKHELRSLPGHNASDSW
jgi:hypothetical protein